MVTGDGQVMHVMRPSMNGKARGTESPVTNRCHSAAALTLATDFDSEALRARQPRARGYRLRNIMTDEDIERWHIRMTPETYF